MEGTFTWAFRASKTRLNFVKCKFRTMQFSFLSLNSMTFRLLKFYLSNDENTWVIMYAILNYLFKELLWLYWPRICELKFINAFLRIGTYCICMERLVDHVFYKAFLTLLGFILDKSYFPLSQWFWYRCTLGIELFVGVYHYYLLYLLR